ncbi:DNA methyltransferase [Microbacterium paraoxydans]|uniref:DNA methylase n=1 Tax=Microbacterium paraoxydans TaxID=199592 RepID=A0A1H1XJQ4_9MICO|nr:DNA methyltransferase [Microbacterium paraoxydans]SDR71785.1 DNA methylase [Microbacterium paraoxydans]SDT09311.1 DNA methylase [Microbacterium paraoxydans]
MTLHYDDAGLRLFHGSNKDILPTFADASFDSIVTDPPYELGFMGKGWDSSGIAYDVDVWRECFRVLKPGGHLLAFGGTRTWHRIAVAIEDAGFEIRDSIAWMYGSGFPKSLNVANAIDKSRNDQDEVLAVTTRLADLAAAAGVTRRQIDEAMGTSDMGGWWLSRIRGRAAIASVENWGRLRDLIPGASELDDEVWRLNGRKGAPGEAWAAREIIGQAQDRRGDGTVIGLGHSGEIARATSDVARQWEGWGTALKPAFEPIIVARKPLVGTVAANVLAYGTGAINIDANRVHTAGSEAKAYKVKQLKPGATLNREGGNWRPDDPDAETYEGETKAGRFPSNVLLDESQAAALDAQTGTLTSGTGAVKRASSAARDGNRGAALGKESRAEGTEMVSYGDSGGASRYFPTFRYAAKAPGTERPEVDGVAHATVKPLDLMRWLVRLVTRRGGHVLDLFAGSGTTGEAALLEGMECTLIELEADHLPLILARVRKPLQTSLFGDWEGGVA